MTDPVEPPGVVLARWSTVTNGVKSGATSLRYAGDALAAALVAALSERAEWQSRAFKAESALAAALVELMGESFRADAAEAERDRLRAWLEAAEKQADWWLGACQEQEERAKTAERMLETSESLRQDYDLEARELTVEVVRLGETVAMMDRELAAWQSRAIEAEVMPPSAAAEAHD